MGLDRLAEVSYPSTQPFTLTGRLRAAAGWGGSGEWAWRRLERAGGPRERRRKTKSQISPPRTWGERKSMIR